MHKSMQDMIASMKIHKQKTREPPVRQDKARHKARNRKYEDTYDEEDVTDDEDIDADEDAGDDGYRTKKAARRYRRNWVGRLMIVARRIASNHP